MRKMNLWKIVIHIRWIEIIKDELFILFHLLLKHLANICFIVRRFVLIKLPLRLHEMACTLWWTRRRHLEYEKYVSFLLSVIQIWVEICDIIYFMGFALWTLKLLLLCKKIQHSVKTIYFLLSTKVKSRPWGIWSPSRPFKFVPVFLWNALKVENLSVNFKYRKIVIVTKNASLFILISIAIGLIWSNGNWLLCFWIWNVWQSEFCRANRKVQTIYVFKHLEGGI